MKAPKDTAPSADAGVAAGEAVFKANCVACHAVDTDTSLFGPNLNGLASREKIAGILDKVDSNGNDITDESLTKWISNPNAVKPGTKMPQVFGPDQNAPATKENIANVIKYLDTLKLK